VDAADAERRIAAQAGMRERVLAARPDVVEVDTSGTPAEAEARVAALWERLVRGSEAPDAPSRRI
jgi:dephospho-CoA kinase